MDRAVCRTQEGGVVLGQKLKTDRKKKKPEIKNREDVKLLPIEEQTKWEIADELGLFDQVVEHGWKSLTGRESGRIGGIISSRQKKTRAAEKNTISEK